MPVTPEFNPEVASTGLSGGQLLGGMETGESLMDRAQLRHSREQADQRAKQEFVAKLPVIQAQAQADVLGAHAAIANATRMTQLRAKANAESVGFNDEFQQAMQEADWGNRADALAALMPKISYMSQFPEYKGFVDAVNNERVRSTLAYAADAKLQELQDVADESRAQRAAAADAMAEARRYAADQALAGRAYAADASKTGRVEAAQTYADARVATSGVNKKYEFETTLERRNQALRDGDQEAAQLYQDRLNKMNSTPLSTPDSARPLPATAPATRPTPEASAPVGVSISIPGSGLPPSGEGAAPEPAPAAPEPASPSPEPTAEPVAPTKVKKSDIKSDGKVSYIEIGGNRYPIFKDKNGNTAYKLGGHWVELKVE